MCDIPTYSIEEPWDLAEESRVVEVLDGFGREEELVTTGEAIFPEWKSVDKVCRAVGRDTLQVLQISLTCYEDDDVRASVDDMVRISCSIFDSQERTAHYLFLSL